jgi:hypothetical protein
MDVRGPLAARGNRPDGIVNSTDTDFMTDCDGHIVTSGVPHICDIADIPVVNAFTPNPQGDGVVDQNDIDRVTTCSGSFECNDGSTICHNYTGRTDTDSDGIPDILDNCVNVANANNFCDSDFDGYGNACDADYSNDGFATGGDAAVFTTLQTAGDLHADHSCDGFVTGGDTGPFIATLGSGTGLVGPSGLACAGLPINVGAEPCRIGGQ